MKCRFYNCSSCQTYDTLIPSNMQDARVLLQIQSYLDGPMIAIEQRSESIWAKRNIRDKMRHVAETAV